MLRLSKWVMPGILLGLMSCCVLADPPAPPKDSPGTGSQVQTTGPLTEESLLVMLRGLGFEPKIETLDDGSKSYQVRINRDGWDFYLTLSFSRDKKVLWIDAYLGQIPAENKVQSEALVKILKLNFSGTGTAKFVITESGRLYLYMPVNNEGNITPERLRTSIDSMCGYIKDTVAHWKTGTWTAEGKEAVAFRQKVETLYGKVRDAYQEFIRELNPALEGRPVDADRLKKAHEKLMRTIREVRQSMKGLGVPNTPAARELLDVYQRLLEVDESFYANELAEVVRIAEDAKFKFRTFWRVTRHERSRPHCGCGVSWWLQHHDQDSPRQGGRSCSLPSPSLFSYRNSPLSSPSPASRPSRRC